MVNEVIPSYNLLTVDHAMPAAEAPAVEQPSHAGNPTHRGWRGFDRMETWAVVVPALLTFLMGLFNLWSSVHPALPHRWELVRRTLPLEVMRGSRLSTALASFALLLLSTSLWRRKQTAWALTIAVLLASAAAHLMKGLDYEEALCAIAISGWLWAFRDHYHARSDEPSVRQGLLVLAASFAFVLLYGSVGFYLLDNHFGVRFEWDAALRQTLLMFVSFNDPGLEPVTGYGQYFADSIYVVAGFSFGYSLLMLTRPILLRHETPHEDRERATRIVTAYGHSGVAFCVLLPDKTYWFSPGGSVVAYTVVGRLAVAMGDPVGPDGDAAAAITGFRQFCARNDWQPAFYETYDTYLDHYRSCGLSALKVAHEAIVDVQEFSISGKDNKNLRSVKNQLTKAGYTAQVHQPPLSAELMEELRLVSNSWLAMMNGTEKRFSLGWFEDEYVRNCRVLAVHDPEGQIIAFTNIVPDYHMNEATIDLMRRHPEAHKSTMEFLFVSLFEWAKEAGYQTFNLGPSPFAGIGQQSGDPAAERAIHFIYQHMNRFYNFKGLHGFKNKFKPAWRPLYLVYPGAMNLPAVAAAIVRADAGNDSWWELVKGLRGSR